MTENPYRRKELGLKVQELTRNQLGVLSLTCQAIMMRDHGQFMAEWGAAAGEEALILIGGVGEQDLMQVIAEAQMNPDTFSVLEFLQNLHMGMKSDA